MNMEQVETKTNATLSLSKAWGMVAVLFVVYVLAWLDRLMISMLVKPIKASMALSDFEMSLILGPAFAVCYAIFGLPLGWAADRFSRRAVIAIGTLIWSIATIGCGYATNFHELLLWRVLVGIGEAALLPSAYSLIADAFPREKLTLATSTFQMAGKIGSASAFGLGGIAIAFATGLPIINLPFHSNAAPWQLVMVIIGLPGFLAALLIYSFPDPGRKNIISDDKDVKSMGSAIKFMRSKAILMTWMLIAFSALAICGYSMTSWVPTFIERTYHWQPKYYGPNLSLMNIIAAASLLVNGRIVDYLFARGMKDAHLRYYSWLIVIISPAIIYMFFANNGWVFLFCYAIVQFITVPFIVYLSSVVALLAPSSVRGQIIGLFLLVTTISGMGGGPAVVGFLTDFVFKDENLIKYALATVVIGSSFIAFIALRFSLKHLKNAMNIEGK